MNNTLTIGFLAESSKTSVGDRILEGGQIVILGMLIVFSVLAILWGVLSLSKIFFYDIPEKKKNMQSEKPAEKEKNSEPAKKEEPDEVYAENDDGEIIAAITAAISEYLKDDVTYAGGFRVVSFRRNGSAWNRKSN